MIHYYNPSNCYEEHIVKVTIQKWGYRGRIWVKIRGNAKGLAVLDGIDDAIFGKAICNDTVVISDCCFTIWKEEGWYKAFLMNTEGNILEVEGDQREFADMIIGLEIVKFVPMKK